MLKNKKAVNLSIETVVVMIIILIVVGLIIYFAITSIPNLFNSLRDQGDTVTNLVKETPIINQNKNEQKEEFKDNAIIKSESTKTKVLSLENNLVVRSEIGLNKGDEVYGTINQQKDELYKNLAENCNSNCLYYPDQDGNIRVVEGVESVYDKDGNCEGTFSGLEGWVLLGEDGELESFGRNKLSNVKPEELLIYGECPE